MRLADKVAWVTGTGGGIGAAVARRFAAEGATVVATDIAECDIADRAAVDATVAGIARDHGRLDIVVNAAAQLGGTGNVLDLTAADWRRYLSVNLDGSFHVAQAAAREMAGRKRGAIVLVGSINSHAAEPEAAAYVASKGGVLQLTRAMAVDLAEHGIRVNMLSPGPIEVPRNAELFASPPLQRMFALNVPLRRAGTPDEVAAAALFLAEDSSTYVTGIALPVDGGMLAQAFRVG